MLDAPGLFDDIPHGFKMLNDPAIRARHGDLGRRQGRRDSRTRLYSPLMLLSHKAIRGVGDFQGQKIRTQGGAPIQVEPLKKVGVIPVSLPLGEALPAMQNKTIDGMVGAAAPLRRVQVLRHRQADDLSAGDDVCRAGRRQPPVPEVDRAGARSRSSARSRARPKWCSWIGTSTTSRRKEDIWTKNGGEVITMAPAEAKRYVDTVAPVAAAILSANPKVKEDYEALLAAAKKYRQ